MQLFKPDPIHWASSTEKNGYAIRAIR